MRRSVVNTTQNEEAIAARHMHMTVAELREHMRTYRPPIKQTVDIHPAAAVERFMVTFATGELSRNQPTDETLRTYDCELRSLFASVAAERPDILLHEVEKSDVRAWLLLPPRRRYSRSVLQAGGLRPAPAAWNKKLAIARKFFRYALAKKWVATDPAAEIDWQDTGPKVPRALGRQEYRRLLKAVRHGKHAERDVLMLRLLGESGLRITSLVNLRVGDVFFPPPGKDAGWLVLSKGKGRRRGGGAILLPDLVPAMKAYLAHAGLTAQLGSYLFHRPGNPSKPITARHAWGIFRRALVRAGLADLAMQATPHSLRHMFAYSMKDAGVPLDDIQQLLNHSSLQTTMIYTLTPTNELCRKVPERLRLRRRH